MNIHTHHRLASGRIIAAGAMVRAVRLARANPDAHYRETFCSPYPVGGTGRDVLREFSNYCQAEINRRGGLVVRQDTPASFGRRQRKLCQRARNSECKWCGSDVGRYVPDGRAFCDASCFQSYYR